MLLYHFEGKKMTNVNSYLLDLFLLFPSRFKPIFQTFYILLS